nr:molybdate ABC transporter substrate-binding protein [Propionibacterium sp.]
MWSRRTVLSVLAVLPLAGCTSTAPAAPASPAASGGSAAASGAPSAAGTPVVVYAPGALAAHTKTIAAAYAAAGLGTVSFEVGHTPVQREQLAQGATPDVWIAASPTDMQTAADKGLVKADAVEQLATTRLVVVVAPGNPGKVTALTDLARPGVKVLLAVETLPIWTTTKKTFDKVEATTPGFTAAVLANTVSRELGVSAIVQKVQLGEADAGVVFVTDVPAGSPVGTVAVPDDVNTTLSLSLAPVTAGKNPAGAASFIEFMTRGQGKSVLTQAGYLPPAA